MGGRNTSPLVKGLIMNSKTTITLIPLVSAVLSATVGCHTTEPASTPSLPSEAVVRTLTTWLASMSTPDQTSWCMFLDRSSAQLTSTLPADLHATYSVVRASLDRACNNLSIPTGNE